MNRIDRLTAYTFIARWLLGYMEDAEVVSPDALREVLEVYSERLYGYYCNVSD